MESPPPSTAAELHPARVLANARGWSIQRLAAEAGMGHRTVDYIVERRRIPTDVQLHKLASALGVGVSDLKDPTPPEHNIPTNPNRRPWGATNAPVEAAVDRFKAARGD
jgi:transcriptional regulator with XRE-family HTH domain